MTNLGSLLGRAADGHPDHPALRLEGLVLTYSQLREAAGRMSTLLAAHGVQPGDRVGIMLPNVPAFPISFYGALAAGARSEERRVGKECPSKCRSRWSPYH